MKISEFSHRNHARLGRHSGLQNMAKLLKSKGVIRLNGELTAELRTPELPRFVAIFPGKISEFSAVPAAGKFAHNISDKAFGIAKEHQSLIQKIQRIFNAREASAHAALNHHHRASFINIQYWHSA